MQQMQVFVKNDPSNFGESHDIKYPSNEFHKIYNFTRKIFKKVRNTAHRTLFKLQEQKANFLGD